MGGGDAAAAGAAAGRGEGAGRPRRGRWPRRGGTVRRPAAAAPPPPRRTRAGPGRGGGPRPRRRRPGHPPRLRVGLGGLLGLVLRGRPGPAAGRAGDGGRLPRRARAQPRPRHPPPVARRGRAGAPPGRAGLLGGPPGGPRDAARRRQGARGAAALATREVRRLVAACGSDPAGIRDPLGQRSSRTWGEDRARQLSRWQTAEPTVGQLLADGPDGRSVGPQVLDGLLKSRRTARVPCLRLRGCSMLNHSVERSQGRALPRNDACRSLALSL
jgi:hypothetical protein